MPIPKMKVIDNKIEYQCKVFNIQKDSLQDASGRTYDRFTVKHPGAVVIIPVMNDGTLLLVDQYRHSISRSILEFPAGTLEPNESPLETAKREICEEVGYEAEEWIPIGTLFPAPGFCDELQSLFVAKNLSAKKLEADDDEYIEVVQMSVSEVETAVRENTLLDAKSIAAFYRARLCSIV